MYAIVKTGGKQYQVSPGDIIEVEKMTADEGEMVSLDQVLLVSSDDTLKVGTPYLDNAEVRAKVVKQDRGKKITVFKLKRRKQYRRTYGHRQDLTRLKIESISAGEESLQES